MVITFSILFGLSVIIPLLLWFSTNFAKIVMHIEIGWVKNNGLKIFLISFAISMIFLALLILALAGIL